MSSDRNQPMVYVAGPFRGPNQWVVTQNIRRAEELAMACWKAGFAAVCPHTNAPNGEGYLKDETWLQGDLTIMYRCDAVIVVPGYEHSRGTKAEIALAIQRGIPVFYDLDSMVGHFTMAARVRMPAGEPAMVFIAEGEAEPGYVVSMTGTHLDPSHPSITRWRGDMVIADKPPHDAPRVCDGTQPS